MGLFSGNPFKNIAQAVSSGVEQLGKNTTSGINQLSKNTSAGFDSAVNIGINKPLQLVTAPLNAVGGQLTPQGASLLGQGVSAGAGVLTGGGSGLFGGLSGLFGGGSAPVDNTPSNTGGMFTPSPQIIQMPSGGVPSWAIPAAIAGVVLVVLIARK